MAGRRPPPPTTRIGMTDTGQCGVTSVRASPMPSGQETGLQAPATLDVLYRGWWSAWRQLCHSERSEESPGRVTTQRFYVAPLLRVTDGSELRAQYHRESRTPDFARPSGVRYNARATEAVSAPLARACGGVMVSTGPDCWQGCMSRFHQASLNRWTIVNCQH
jgi:hypothetical protein